MSAKAKSTPKFPQSANQIKCGAFIKSQYSPWYCGIVVKRGTVCGGRIPGFIVRLANGRRDFIPADDAVLIAA